MIHKRPFVGDDDSCELSCKHKHPRQMEHFDHLDTELWQEGAYEQWHAHPLGDGVDDTSGKDQDFRSSASESVSEFSNGADKDIESGVVDCFHQYWWNDGIVDTDMSLFPEILDYGHQLGTSLELDEILSPIDSPFRKPVAIGSEHQAFVPDWNFQINQKHNDDRAVQSGSQDATSDYTCEEKLLGTCVIPMPEIEAPSEYSFQGTEINCKCHDEGSIRCVKQHITEARQKLREYLGEELFEGLGFHEMGEDVAMKWTRDEEQSFHQVVLAYPASLGKNFWDHLPAYFPSLARKDLISYYFNVFMLWKRAEQNRFDLLNIDSDDDEWQGYESDELRKDEDSAVESPTGQDGPDPTCCWEALTEDRNGRISEYDEVGDFEEESDDNVQIAASNEEGKGNVDDMP